MTELERCPKCHNRTFYPVLGGRACYRQRCGYRYTVDGVYCEHCGDTGVAFDHEDRQIACACIVSAV